MIENYRTGSVWRRMMRSPVIQRGLERAGFTAPPPEHATATAIGPPPDELETLASLLRVIVDLDCGSQAWKTVARRLEYDGWAVRARVGWVVEARRGRDFEQAAAPTRD